MMVGKIPDKNARSVSSNLNPKYASNFSNLVNACTAATGIDQNVTKENDPAVCNNERNGIMLNRLINGFLFTFSQNISLGYGADETINVCGSLFKNNCFAVFAAAES